MTSRQFLLAGSLALALCASPALAEDRFDRLLRDVERIRELKFGNRVPWELRTQAAMGEQISREAREDAPSVDERALALFLHRLGMVPAGFDVRAFLLGLYADQVRGLYDPDSKTFYVVGTGQAAPDAFTMEDVTAVHELQHALQDQHFDLRGYQSRLGKAPSDEALAGRCVVEGEAQLVSTAFAVGASGMSVDQLGSSDAKSRTAKLDPQGKLAAAPLYFRRLLSFPYTAGLDLVLHVRQAGGWDLVGRMFQDPPASTEQVMHPERYLERRDPPLRVALNLPAQIAGFSQISEDVGGEFMVSCFLEQHLGYQASLGPAKGWGGDLYRVYTRGSEDFSLWLTTWDSEGEARQFSAAARQAFRKAKIADAVVEDRGPHVVLYLGAPPEARQEIAGHLERLRVDPLERKVLVERPATAPRPQSRVPEPEVKENRYLLESDGFRSITHGFFLPVPGGWVPEPNKGEVRMPVSLVRVQGNAKVVVVVLRLPRDTAEAPPAEKERVAAMAEQLRASFPGAETVAARTIPGPVPFLEVEASAGRRRISAYEGESLGRTYTFVLAADEGCYAAARKELVGALRRMTFTKPGTL